MGCILLWSLRPPHILGKEWQSLQAPLHWHSLPRVPTAVTSIQTMRAGSTVLHHIFILNCDFSRRLNFPESQSHHVQPCHTTCNLLTSWFYNSADTWYIHPLALGVATMRLSSLLSRLLPSHMALTAVTAPMGVFSWTWKSTLQPSTGLSKESKSSGSLLDYPCQKPLRVCPKAHLHLWLLLTTWQRCGICQGCNTQPW